MKNYLLYSSLLVLLTGCFSTQVLPPQNTNQSQVQSTPKVQNPYKDKYAAFMEEGSTLIQSGYHYTIEKMASTGLIVTKTYHPDKMVMNYLVSRHPETDELEGAYEERLDDGSIVKAGFYKNGLKQGHWNLGYSSGNYVNDKKEGTWNYYDLKGRLKSKEDFINGEKVEGSKVDIELVIDEEEAASKAQKEEVFRIVEEMPRFAGCEDEEGDHTSKKKCADRKMLVFIYKSLRYPAIARENDIEGTAILQFVVGKEGAIKDLIVKKGLCKEIEEECIRVIESMPNWIPGKIQDEPVDVKFTLPIKFKLE